MRYLLIILGVLSLGGVAYGAFGDPFISIQTGVSPADGYVLQTDGTDSSWVATSSLGISSGVWTDVVTHLQPTGGGGIIVNASSTVVGPFTITGTLTAPTFVINGDTFTDFTGAGLSVSGGTLNTTLGNSVSLTSEVTGTLPVANGGTGATSLDDILGTTNQVSVLSGANTIIGGNVTLSLPQDIDVGADLQLDTVTVNSTSATSTFANGILLTGGCFQDTQGCVATRTQHVIIDDDSDTAVNVEFNTDEDIIRFVAANNTIMTIDTDSINITGGLISTTGLLNLGQTVDLSDFGGGLHAGFLNDWTASSTSDDTTQFSPYVNQITVDGTSNFGNQFGILGVVKNQGTGDGSIYGIQNTVSQTDANHAPEALAMDLITSLSNSATASTSGARITNIVNPGSTVTNLYGLKIDQVNLGTVDNLWGISQSNTSAINYFAGNVGVATDTPSFPLAVNGSALFNGNVNGADFNATGTVIAQTGLTIGDGTATDRSIFFDANSASSTITYDQSDNEWDFAGSITPNIGSALRINLGEFAFQSKQFPLGGMKFTALGYEFRLSTGAFPFRIDGLGQASFDDNNNACFGTGTASSIDCDATIDYDGTDFVFNPQVIGSGNMVLSAGDFELGDNQNITFGTGNDATIDWDATNLVIEPGTGQINVEGEIDINANIFTSGTAPTLSTCHTSPSVVSGNDRSGLVDVGSGTMTAVCTVNFNVAYSATPICFLQSYDTAGATVLHVNSISTTGFTVRANTNFTANDQFAYRCEVAQ